MSSVPNWGFVSAAPHERLLHLRDGAVLRSVQGGSCFKRPGDTVALVDTSVKRLQFTADQITREKVGVGVTGLAVFRVVEPLLAYQMLNLEDPKAYQEILREMFVGATRRLVANLALDECLTRRKDALAAELMAEVAPVVQGSGREADATHQGWGIVLDTIEIQDVRVLSEEVFVRLQAPYREELALGALAARADVEREEARLAAERARARESSRRELMALEEQRLEAERARNRIAAAHEAELKKLSMEAELLLAEQRAQAEHLLQEARAESRVRVAGRRAEAERLLGEARVALSQQERAVAAEVSPGQLQEILLTQTLPRMAEAFRGSVETAVVVGGGESSYVAQGVASVVAALQAFGIAAPRGA